MALERLLPGQTQVLMPAGPLPDKFESQAFFKSKDLQVIRLLMPEGYRMVDHSVEGEITLQCLKGCVAVRVQPEGDPDQKPPVRLVEGELMYLERKDLHQLLAVVSSVVILTIALHVAD